MDLQDKYDSILLSLYETALGDVHWRATSALIDDGVRDARQSFGHLRQGADSVRSDVRAWGASAGVAR